MQFEICWTLLHSAQQRSSQMSKKKTTGNQVGISSPHTQTLHLFLAKQKALYPVMDILYMQLKGKHVSESITVVAFQRSSLGFCLHFSGPKMNPESELIFSTMLHLPFLL